MKKFRQWWAWQDHEHGVWLQDMAAQGWHLVSVNWLDIYTFERGEPAEVAYRWDLHVNNFEPEYRRLLEDAGWEYVVAHGGWHCWRQPIVGGRVPEIFTDPADRRRRYRRLLIPAIAIVVAQLLLLCHWSDWGSAPLALTALNWLTLGIGAIAGYNVVQLGRRMAALKATG